MIRPLTITIPFPMGMVTGIHIAALDILWIIGTPARGVDAPGVGAGFGMDADSVCGPRTRTEVRRVSAVAVEGGEYGCGEKSEEGKGKEVHYERTDILI
jgi:hypothetical protein